MATRRSDLVTSGDPLFYVLAGRPEPDALRHRRRRAWSRARRFSARSSRDLERARPAAVVRFTSAVTAAPEPNRAGESSGVRILDDYLERAYRPVARDGRLRAQRPQIRA